MKEKFRIPPTLLLQNRTGICSLIILVRLAAFLSVRRTRSRTIYCAIRGDWGLATNKQFSGFRASEKLENWHRGSHDALLAAFVSYLF
ncbi:MAG TPA: hypothetical protein DEP42_02745 [Ruminococcaceae bacterium]|nr:hypothetical protein [Oscillospiraceae bacterium]